MLMDKLFEHFR